MALTSAGWDGEGEVLLESQDHTPTLGSKRCACTRRRATLFGSLALVAGVAFLSAENIGAQNTEHPPIPAWVYEVEALFQVPKGGDNETHIKPNEEVMGKGEEGCPDVTEDKCDVDTATLPSEGDFVLDPFQQSAVDTLHNEGTANRLLRQVKSAARRLLQSTEYDPHNGAIELWPGGVVKYAWDGMSDQCVNEMKKAMQAWEAKTCLRFEEVPDGKGKKGVVTYHSRENGCHAHLGYGQHWPHKLNLGQGCCTHGVALHELGHVIGLRHEHARPEAKPYIKFNTDKIKEWWKQFIKTENDMGDVSAGVPYDMGSIMHYGPHAGCKSWDEKTIEVVKKDIFGNCQVGNRDHLSEGDIITINRWYGCPDHVCADLHGRCGMWEKHGHCTGKYESWMKDNCPHSCGVCECDDSPEYTKKCPGWASSGYCWRGHKGSLRDKSFMIKHCRKSCGNCLMEDVSLCKDKPLWGDEKGCEKNPEGVATTAGHKDCTDNWFAATCAKTCKICPHNPFCW